MADDPVEDVFIEDELLDEDSADAVGSEPLAPSEGGVQIARQLSSSEAEHQHRVERSEADLDVTITPEQIELAVVGGPRASFAWPWGLEFDATGVDYWQVGAESSCPGLLALRVVGFVGEDIRRARFGFAVVAISNAELRVLWSDQGQGTISLNCGSFADFEVAVDDAAIEVRRFEVAEIYEPGDPGYDCEDAVEYRKIIDATRWEIPKLDC